MKEACIGRHQTLIADDEAPNVPHPGERPRHHPPPPPAPPLPPILLERALVVPADGEDRLHPPAGHAGPQGIAVIAPIRDQAFGALRGEMDTDRFPWVCGASSPRQTSRSIGLGDAWREDTVTHGFRNELALLTSSRGRCAHEPPGARRGRRPLAVTPAGPGSPARGQGNGPTAGAGRSKLMRSTRAKVARQSRMA